MQDNNNLIPTTELIKIAQKQGINLGKGDPNNRIRYYTKIGLLPHAQRKMVEGEDSTVGHYPLSVLETLKKIQGLRENGLSPEEIKARLQSVSVSTPPTPRSPASPDEVGPTAPLDAQTLLSKIENLIDRAQSPDLARRNPAPRDEGGSPFPSGSFKRQFLIAGLSTLLLSVSLITLVMGVDLEDRLKLIGNAKGYFQDFGRNLLENFDARLASQVYPPKKSTIKDINDVLAYGEDGKLILKKPLSLDPALLGALQNQSNLSILGSNTAQNSSSTVSLGGLNITGDINLSGRFSGGQLDAALTNLVKNSSFEANPTDEKKPRFWNYLNQSTENNTRISQKSVHTGNLALEILSCQESVKDCGAYFGISQPVTLTRWGASYTLSAFFRPFNAQFDKIRFSFWDNAKKQRVSVKEFSASDLKSDDWTRLFYTMDNSNLPEGKNFYPFIEIINLTSGSVFIDDVQMEEGTISTVYHPQTLEIGDGAIIASPAGDFYPRQNGAGSLGLSSNKFLSLYLNKGSIDQNGNLLLSGGATIDGGITTGNNLTVEGTTTLRGDINFGNQDTDSLNFTARIGSNIAPSANNSYDLGSDGLRWRTGYFGTSVVVGPSSTTLSNGMLSTGGTFSLRANGSSSNQVFVDSSGNVGIGTSSPAYLFDTFGQAGVGSTTAGTDTVQTLVLRSPSDNNNNYSGISFSGWANYPKGAIGFQKQALSYGRGAMIFMMDNAVDTNPVALGDEVMRLTNTGWLGIGTANPSAMLSVGSANNFTVDNSGNITTSTTGIALNMTGTNPTINNSSGNLILSSNGTFSLRTYGSSSNQVFVDSSGNFGIGTTSPNALLAIGSTNQFTVSSTGNITTSATGTALNLTGLNPTVNNSSGNLILSSNGTFSLRTNGSASNQVFVDASGNVGVNTTTPSALFAVGSANNFTVDNSGNLTTSTTGIALNMTGMNPRINNSSGNLLLSSNGTFSLRTQGSSSNQVFVDASGNVGLNQTNPAYLLDVNGTARLGATQVTGAITASTGSLDIGTIGTKFGTIYADTVNATALIGTVIGGSTNSSDWTINNDNDTADTQAMSLAFERGTSTPNALMSWNVTTKSFDFNAGITMMNSVGGSGNLGIGDASPDALLDIDSTSTSGADFLITNTGISTSGSIGTITANSATTGDIFTLNGTALTSGSLLVLTGPSGGTAGVTDAGLKLASDVGNIGTSNGLISSTATIDSTAAAANGINLYLSTTNSNTTNANTAYGVYNALTDAVALANTNYGEYLSVANTGAIDSAITKTIYGSYISSSGTGGAPTTAGTTNVYGQYLTTTASHAANFGTVNQYGLYIANGTSGTNGTSTKYGLYLESPTGADTNYSIYSNGGTSYFAGDIGIATTTPDTVLDFTYTDTNTLHLKSTGATYSRISVEGATAGLDLVDSDTTANQKWFQIRSDGGILRFFSISDDGLTIVDGMTLEASSGNVGINDQSPNAKFDIDDSSVTGPTLGLTNTGIVTGTVASVIADSLTTGTLMDISIDGLTTGKGINLATTSNALDSGTLLNISSSATAATDTSLSADIANLSFSPTYSTAVTTPSITGQVLDISRTVTSNSLFASTLTVSGALATFSDSATQTTGTLTHTADVVNITQNYTSSSGVALYVKNYGGASSTSFRVDDASSDTSPFIIDATGQVGIGTTSPNALLAIGSTNQFTVSSNGNITTSTTGIALNMTGMNPMINNSSGNLILSSNGTFSLRTNGSASNQIFVDASGNVGIGTTAPGGLLHTYGGSAGTAPTWLNGDIIFENVAGQNVALQLFTSASDLSSIQFTDTGGRGYTNGGALGYHHVTDYMFFHTSGTEKMRITSTGNVGIGDTSPDYLLELYDATNTPTFALSDDDVAHGVTTLADTDVFFHLSSLSTTAGGAQLTGLSDADGNSAQPFQIRGVFGTTTPTDTVPAVKIIGGLKSGTDIADLADADTIFQVANNDNTAALTILGDGKVGIGITTPGDTLDIASTSYANITQQTFRNDSGGSAILLKKSRGTSIGSLITTNDGDTLGSIYGYGVDSGNTAYRAIGMLNFEQDGNAAATQVPGRITFYTNDGSGTGEKMRIDKAGNVGIGDTSPDYLLELNDAAATPTFALSDDDIAHGVTTVANTDTFFHLSSISTTDGGAYLQGIADNVVGATALQLRGIQASNPTDTVPAISLIGAKANGTGVQDLAAAETIFQVANNDDAAALTILGSGNVGIGTTSPNALFAVGSTNQFTVSSTGNITTSATGTALNLTGLNPTLNNSSGNLLLSSNGTFALRTQGSSSNQIFVDSGGNLGINTNSPAARVDINSAAGKTALLLDSSDATANQTIFKIQTDYYAANTSVFSVSSGDGSTNIGAAAASSKVRPTLTLNGDQTLKGKIDLITSGMANVNNVFVYDTTKDADGGKWRNDERAKSASWYNETIDATGAACDATTNDRCGRREFPEKAILVVSGSGANGRLYIYDAKDNTMWMSFTGSTDGGAMLYLASDVSPVSVFGLNGKLYVGANQTGSGMLYTFDFIKDENLRTANNTSQRFRGKIADRGSAYSMEGTVNPTWGATYVVIDRGITDVFARVINGKTYIAVATVNGLTVLNETDRLAYDYADNASDNYNQVWLDRDGNLWATNATTDTLEKWNKVVNDTADENPGTPDATWDETTTPALTATTPAIQDAVGTAGALAVTDGTSTVDGTSPTVYLGTDLGLSVLQTKAGDETNSSVKYYSKDFITEEMVGDIRAMWPLNADNASSDLEDVSVKTNNLTAANIDSNDSATGVRSTATDFDGSTENLSIPTLSDADLDFNGTESFSASFWVYPTAMPGTGEQDAIFSKWDATSTQRGYRLILENDDADTTGNFQVDIYDESADQTITATQANDVVNLNTWYFVTITFNGGQAGAANDLKLYVNGVLNDGNDANASFLGLEDVTSDVVIADYDADDAVATSTGFTGRIDEGMVAAEVLTYPQIKHIYEVGRRALDEHTASRITGVTGADNYQRLMGNASGGTTTSNNVTAVAVDDSNQYIYAGVSDASGNTGGVTVLGVDSDSAIDLYDGTANTGKDDDAGTQFSANDVVAISVVGTPTHAYNSGTTTNNNGAVLAIGGTNDSATRVWMQSSDYSLYSTLAQLTSPDSIKDNITVNNIFRVFNTYNNLTSSTNSERIETPAFQVDSLGNLVSQSMVNSTTAMQFKNAAGTVVFNIDTSNNNVGIGTTTPSTNLQVLGNGRFGSATSAVSTQRALTIRDTGDLAALELEASGTGGRNWAIFTLDTTSTAAIGGAGNLAVRDVTGSATRMLFDAGGNVSINTISPAATLHVAGSARIGGGYLCVKSTDAACAGTTAGTIYATNTTVQGADYAENYISAEILEPGDLVSIEPTNSPTAVVKSINAYQKDILGVVSTEPGVTLNSEAQTDADHPYIYPVALSGRVPVKVSTENGNIEKGDFLTASSMSGVAMKASEPGQILGVALESFNSASRDKIMVFINVSFADPQSSLAQNGRLTVQSLTAQSLNIAGGRLTIDETGSLVSSANFTNFALASLNQVTISGNLVSQNTTLLGQTQADNLKILATLETSSLASLAGQDLTVKLVSSSSNESVNFKIVNSQNQALFKVDESGNAVLSGTLTQSGNAADLAESLPVADTTISEGDVVSIGTKPATPKPDSLPTWALVKSSTPYDQAVLGIISEKPSILMAEGSQLNLPKKALALAGRVPVKVSNENGPIASGDYLTTSSTPGFAMKATKTGATIGKALESFSVEPTEKPSYGKILVFVNLSTYVAPDALALTVPELPKSATTSQEPTSGVENTPGVAGTDSPGVNVISSATPSALLADNSTLPQLPQSLASSGNLTLDNLTAKNYLEAKDIKAETGSFSENLKVFGLATVRNMAVADTLTVGGTLSLADNSLDSLTGTLYLQNKGLGGLDILAGKITIDKDGTITAAGQVLAGSIVTNKLTVSNSPVASASAQNIPASIGSGKLEAGQTSLTVTASQITANSKVFITPRSSTAGQTLFVQTINAGLGFIVGLDHPTDHDINFDWWIVETR